MSESRPDLFVVINPWQARMAAMLYSVAPDITRLPILVWDPNLLAGYFKLKDLASQVRASESEIEGLLPISSKELLKRIETRISLFEQTIQETISLVSHYKPRKILILADTIPSPWFWHSVPADTEVSVLAYPPHQQDIEQLARDSVFGKFNPTISIMTSPADVLAQLWQTLNQGSLPKRTEVIIAGETPEEMLTGIYQARKESIPLLIIRNYGEPMVIKTVVEDEQFSSIATNQYELIKSAKLCEIPSFNCILESSANLDFVVSVIYAFERRGQIVLCQPPPVDVVKEAEDRVKAISNLIFSESDAEAHREVDYLSRLVTDRIPQHVRNVLAELPETPVQIVGTPFPYSLCKTTDGTQYWAGVHRLAFLPISQASRVFLRNLETPLIEDVHRSSLCALVDSLSSEAQTETEFILTNLKSRGSYCINLKGPNAITSTVKSVLNYLPLDICLFVTHGTENALLLRDDFLSSDEIKTLPLKGRAFIINNSCLSWTGVGDAFIDGGARGFIGTYWTIENAVAANIAQDLIMQLLEGKPASRALQIVVQQKQHSLTHLAYIFVGLHDTKLPIRQPLNPAEAEGLAWVEILENAREAILFGDDLVSAWALWRLAPSPGEINLSSLTPATLCELVLAQFGFLRGAKTFGGNISIDDLLQEGSTALEIIQQGGTDKQLYQVLSELGVLYLSRQQQGDIEEAEKCFLKALDIERRSGYRSSEARELGNLGVVYDAKGDFATALEYHQQALAINKEMANTRDEVLDLENIARSQLALGDLSSSLESAKQALSIQSKIADFRITRLQFCVNFAKQLINMGHYQIAKDFTNIPIQDISQKMNKKKREITQLEALILIEAVKLSVDYLENRYVDFRTTEEGYALIAEVARDTNLFSEFFSAQFKRIDLLNKMQRFDSISGIMNDIVFMLEKTKDSLSREMYEAVLETLQVAVQEMNAMQEGAAQSPFFFQA